MRFNYIIDPSILETPFMKKLEDEDRLLSELLLDLVLVVMLKKGMSGMKNTPSVMVTPVSLSLYPTSRRS